MAVFHRHILLLVLTTFFLGMAAMAGAETGVATSGVFSLNMGGTSGIDPVVLPQAPSIDRVYPNPFNPAVTISYRLPEQAMVEMAVFDLRGRLVQTLVDRQALAAGEQEAVWRGQDDSGQRVAGGVYLCRLRVDDTVLHHRLTLVK